MHPTLDRVVAELVVLEAAAGDWPRHWYARRGFEPPGSVWSLSREP